MAESSPISTNLLGRRVCVSDDAMLRSYGGTPRHPIGGEIVGLHRHGCDYMILVLHDDGIVKPYGLEQVTFEVTKTDDDGDND